MSIMRGLCDLYRAGIKYSVAAHTACQSALFACLSTYIIFFCHFLLFSNALLYVYGACLLKLTLLCEILCVLLHFEQ